ncbi:MAG: KH domain-containing protein [Oscillospiraceae bacterium]|nr:KH domain-containing protein [Oscillospiraceae bacterium]MCD8376491.1 KH domain-containing protein [Oscillospiraceae bacterium]
MKELLTYIVQNLVDHPEDVRIDDFQRGNELTLEVRVNSDDMGKVIGRQGRIAKSIRSVMRSAAQRQGLRVNVEIKD